jgi:hypothetical protein
VSHTRSCCVAIGLAIVLAVGVSGCRSAYDSEVPDTGPPWDLSSAEILDWDADRAEFQQDHALEGSGLAASDRYLYATSEKYWRLLQIAPDDGLVARVVELDVPRHTELEGVAYDNGSLYFCDEAHAAVYHVGLPDEAAIASGAFSGKLKADEKTISGPTIRAGKIGIEGIEVSPDGGLVWLLLERKTEEDGRCVSPIYLLRPTEDALVEDGPPLIIELEDCNWRLTGLDVWNGRLLALKTQFPGERYEVISIDPDTGRWDVVLEMTEELREVRRNGFNNNVEGLAVTDDGALWLVSDNAWTEIIDDPVPPVADERTLLMRIPPSEP